MRRSQNLYFEGESPKDILENPLGAGIARGILKLLLDAGYTVGPLEKWVAGATIHDSSESDLGWTIKFSKNGELFSMLFSTWTLGWIAESNGWLLTIAPEYIPGYFARKFKNKEPSATSRSVSSVAVLIHSHITKLGYENIFWEWDGDPDKNSSKTPENS